MDQEGRGEAGQECNYKLIWELPQMIDTGRGMDVRCDEIVYLGRVFRIYVCMILDRGRLCSCF
jgi:hypothetical protein